MRISDWSSDVCASDLLGQGKALPGDLHRQPGNDAEGQRDTQVEDRTCPRSAGNPDTAADALDILAHHVKPDPAPGYRADRLGCRKTGREDQLQYLIAAHTLRFRLADQPVCDSLGGNPGFVQAASVVADRKSTRLNSSP